MALLTYNTINLPYTDLTDFRMEAVYEDSDTDRYLTRFFISSQAVLTPDYLKLLLSGLSAPAITSPVEVIHLVYQLLMTPRKQLSLKFNGVEMIPQRQAGVTGYVDAVNGPKPRRCNIIPIDGATNGTFILLYEIEASYWVNVGATQSTPPLNDTNINLPGNVVLYNRWSETVDLNEQQQTTKTRRGKLMIRSDNAKGWIADQVRNSMAVVGLTPGRFVRERSSYTVDPNGLGLEYTVVDREVFRLPPPPAYKAEGVYNEDGTKGDGKRYVSYRIKLWGDNDTVQSNLLRTAAAICVTKITRAGANVRSNPGLIISSNLRVGSYENWVEFSIRALVGPSQGRIGGADLGLVAGALAGGAGQIGAFFGIGVPVSANATLLSDPAVRPIYLSRGTADIILQAAKYYDPSLQNVQLGPSNAIALANMDATNTPNAQLNQGKEPGTEGTNP